jgi:hypothetical protein
MKKSFYSQLFAIALAVCLLSSINLYAQDAISLGHTSKTTTGEFLAECTGAGSLIYDDNTFENGYGWNPATITEGRFVSLFTPTNYPWHFTTFCAAFTRLSTSQPNFNFDIVVYNNDGTGGAPGTLVTTIAGLTATNLPVWPSLGWYDYDVSSIPDLASGSYYIGIKYNPGQSNPTHYSGADESTTTPLHPGYAWNSSDQTWVLIGSVFTSYRAMSYRTLGEQPGGPGPATNPNPANGATNVPITGTTLSWSNPGGATSCNVYFGPVGNMVQVHTGSLISQYALGTLSYGTTYNWRVDEIGAGGTSSGATWAFSTVQDPNLVTETVDIYPDLTADANYWTGTCNASTKTQVSLVNAQFNDFGWMSFITTPIVNDPTTTILNVVFYGYLYNNAWPYWSITPMGGVNPVTADASAIWNQINNSWQQGVAYGYFQESGTLPNNAYLIRTLGTSVYTDLKNALNQGWFAIGIVDFDFSSSWYVHFQGWAETNKPYLKVTYQYVVPVELTSFTASAMNNDVVLNWATATEINNQGFEVERGVNGQFTKIGFVAGNGTTTQANQYTYTDRGLANGTYSYRLRQVDFDGTFEYSPVVEVDVNVPVEFTLGQNYPNPFNPSTTITFGLSVDSKVSLKVFDVLGQQVAVLVDGNLGQGPHEINFDASSLNSGVYFYTIEAKGVDGNSFMNTKKMILTK